MAREGEGRRASPCPVGLIAPALLLVSTFADSFLEVNHGVVSRPPREERLRRLGVPRGRGSDGLDAP